MYNHFSMKNSIFLFGLFILVSCQNNAGKTKSEKIDHIVREFVNDGEFAGTVLVADDRQIIYKQSFGDADHALKIANTDTTRFLIGSVSKPITAILILRLVAAGKLSVDDTIGKFFPQASPDVSTITVHQLLTHTSGIGEIISKDSNMDLDALVQSAKLKSPVQNTFEYSNSGYVILKEIAERSTGKEYPELIEQKYLCPLV
jgi:CubicO group peptidase (beta-lactamase class C family)